MAYITENQLSNMMDVPVALPATDLRMGDWVVVSTVKVVAPMRLTYRMANLNVMLATVDTALVTNGNKIYGNLGLAYLALRLNYSTGSPGAAGGLDVLVANVLGITSRDASTSVVVTVPGIYSWIVANNMQPSTDTVPLIPTSTSIDFRLAVTGTVRLDLDAS